MPSRDPARQRQAGRRAKPRPPANAGAAEHGREAGQAENGGQAGRQAQSPPRAPAGDTKPRRLTAPTRQHAGLRARRATLIARSRLPSAAALLNTARNKAPGRRADASGKRQEKPEGKYHGADLAQAISGRRARRYRRDPIHIAGRIAGRELCEVRDRKAFICMDKSISYRDLDEMSLALARLSAEQGPAKGRPRRADDAERAAISDSDRGRAARGLCGGQRQSALHAARARAPAEGFRRRGDRRAGEFRHHRAAGDRQDRGQACHHRQHGRPARPQGRDRQSGGAPGQEDGAGLFAAGRGRLQRRDRGRPRHEAQQAASSRPTTSPSCNIPAAPPASPRARRCFTQHLANVCRRSRQGCRTTPGCSRR